MYPAEFQIHWIRISHLGSRSRDGVKFHSVSSVPPYTDRGRSRLCSALIATSLRSSFSRPQHTVLCKVLQDGPLYGHVIETNIHNHLSPVKRHTVRIHCDSTLSIIGTTTCVLSCSSLTWADGALPPEAQSCRHLLR